MHASARAFNTQGGIRAYSPAVSMNQLATKAQPNTAKAMKSMLPVAAMAA
jgi:hypothetical protein